MRSFFLGSKVNVWANPYVTDGLVAMWDGEWNAGGGVHDASATSWRELIGGTDCEWSLSTIPTWEAKAWRSLSNTDGGYFRAFWPDGLAAEHTIEVVSQKDVYIRGVIFGSFGIQDANQVNIEYYSNRNFRAYYNGIINIVSSNESWQVGVPSYFSVRHSEKSYDVVNGYGVSFMTQTSDKNPLTPSSAYIGSDGRYGSMCFYGRIYSIRIYNRALSASEIAANYEIDKRRFGL